MVDEAESRLGPGDPALTFEGRVRTYYNQDGVRLQGAASYFRGDHTNFHPKDRSLKAEWCVREYIAKGLMPDKPLFDRESSIVAFGSCFAHHISHYLNERGFGIPTLRDRIAYISEMGDGLVNTYAIRQQFEWAWLDKAPTVNVWHGDDLKALGFDEEIRLATKSMLDSADAFIITLGLSEIWYDEPTAEVFWRAVPTHDYDPSRHKFRLATYEENVANLEAILDLIRAHRPDAEVILTLSPIPLMATFRPIPCVVADAESKAILRTAVGHITRTRQDERLHYFPAYEIVQRFFNHAYTYDRIHVHRHIIDFAMAVFERYYCVSDLTDEALFDLFTQTQATDRFVALHGHKSVPSFKVMERPVTPPIGS